MPFEISTGVSFSAAHYIEGYEGDCARLHGHTWNVRVAVRVAKEGATGLTYDFRDLRTLVGDVIGRLDHSLLNDLPFFKGKNPTAEAVAEWVHHEVAAKIETAGVAVARVEVWESPLNCATYLEE